MSANLPATKSSSAPAALAEWLAQFRNKPLDFVLAVFPWGEPGPLQDEYPDRWQIEVMRDIQTMLEVNETLSKDQRQPIQIAIASGHGIGKTALISWIIMWFIATNVEPQIVATANTKSQLTTKTWRELSVWHNRSLLTGLFEWHATSYRLKEKPNIWTANAIPWSKTNPESFAGTHAPAVLYVFDEGSAIDEGIYDVSEGAMTTERCIWLVFGNMTRNTGRFRELFGKLRHRWITRSIDSRSARKTNKAKIQQWLDDHGEDSDFFRVRVRGLPPKKAYNQLISEDDVDRAMSGEFKATGFEFFPVAITCDVARFGDDSTTVGVYQGRKQHEGQGYQGLDTVQTATLVAKAYQYWRGKVAAGVRVHCFIDDVGVGGGVVDMLAAWGIPVTGVNAGAKADDPEKFFNKRAEMWWRGAEALKAGYELLESPRMRDDLVNMEYFMTPAQKIQLESVRDLKDRGLASPDYATNFVLQFAYPVGLDIKSPQEDRPRSLGGSSTMQKRKELGYGSRRRG